MMKSSLARWGMLALSLSAFANTALAANWQRTVVFMYGQTQTGQDMFIRGGIDHTYALNKLGRNCTVDNKLCAIPIQHLNLKNTTTNPWKTNDKYLDWYGNEPTQSAQAVGTPMDWTTNVWPGTWGPKKTVEIDGYGETSLNAWGQHYWMMDVLMDCSATVNGWFELKSYISNGPGWEANVTQAGAPYVTGNHFAQCGKVNKFERGSNAALIQEFPMELPVGMQFCNAGSACVTTVPTVTLCATGQTSCAAVKSTTVRLQINGQAVNHMEVTANTSQGFEFISNNSMVYRSGGYIYSNGVAQYKLQVGAGVDLTSLTWYNVVPNWSGDTVINFSGKTVKRTNGFSSIIWYPGFNLGATPEQIADFSQQVYLDEVAISGYIPPAYRAYYSPADINPMGGDGNWSTGDGAIFMNYGNPPWLNAVGATAFQIMKKEFAHEHQHTIYAAGQMPSKLIDSQYSCINEGFSDGLGNFLGHVSDDTLAHKDSTDYSTLGCQVAGTPHAKGDCVFLNLKRAGYLTAAVLNKMYHPSRVYQLESCNMTTRSTGNNFVVYLSESTGVDMASFVKNQMKIPAADSLSQAKAELGLQ